MITISRQDSIYSIVEKNKKIQEVLVQLGFTPMAQAINLNSIGRVTSLETAIKHLGIPFDEIQNAFASIGVVIADE